MFCGWCTFSKITDWKRRDCVFFGDGAARQFLVIQRNEDGFISANLNADGRGKMAWTVPAGGSELPASQVTIKEGAHTFLMDGKAVFDTATVVLPEAINEVLSSCELKIEDTKYVIPHQPSIGPHRKPLKY